MEIFVYILRCRDGRYYVGSTRGSLDRRVAEHNSGLLGGFTKARLPVTLVFRQSFERATDAIAAERQIKGWARAKKEALIRGDFGQLRVLARNRTQHPHPSTGSMHEVHISLWKKEKTSWLKPVAARTMPVPISSRARRDPGSNCPGAADVAAR